MDVERAVGPAAPCVLRGVAGEERDVARQPGRVDGVSLRVLRGKSMSTQIAAPAKSCEQRLKARSRKPGRECGATATHYDAAERRNLCGQHARDNPRAVAGTGPSWWE
jgi:hypothetical protein